MGLKKLGLALIVVAAFGAVVANSAMAAATETEGFWYVGGVKLAEGTEEEITCSLGTESLILESTVGTNNTPLEIEFGETECPGGRIRNALRRARTRLRTRWRKPKIKKPTGCKITGEEVETEELGGQVWMEGTKALARLAPEVGTEWAEIEIEGCAIAGAYPLKGVLFGEHVNATNVSAAEQEVTFSGTINEAAGGALTFGGHSAKIKGKEKKKRKKGGEWKVNET